MIIGADKECLYDTHTHSSLVLSKNKLLIIVVQFYYLGSLYRSQINTKYGPTNSLKTDKCRFPACPWYDSRADEGCKWGKESLIAWLTSSVTDLDTMIDGWIGVCARDPMGG